MNRLLTLTKPNLIPYNQLARNFRSSSRLLVDSSNERESIEHQLKKKELEESEITTKFYFTSLALIAGAPIFGNFIGHTDIPDTMALVSIASYALVPSCFNYMHFNNQINKNKEETQYLKSQLEKLEPNEQVEVNEVNEVNVEAK